MPSERCRCETEAVPINLRAKICFEVDAKGGGGGLGGRSRLGERWRLGGRSVGGAPSLYLPPNPPPSPLASTSPLSLHLQANVAAVGREKLDTKQLSRLTYPTR